MITEGKGTLEEQEASKARDREKFAANAAAREAEEAKFSKRREFIDGSGITWTYAVYNSEAVHIFGCKTADACTPATSTPATPATEACAPTTLEIPAEIENLPVTTLHSSAISNMPALESVKVPASVKQIDKYAFKGCPNLRCVGATCGATEYNPAWFDVSRNIEELALPNGVQEIKAGVFDQPLKRLIIGTNTSAIAPGAFGRSKLESIDITPDNPHLKTDGTGIYTKDGEVFLALARPVESYTVVPGTKKLAKKAFSTFACLTSVNLPDSVEVIDEFCFSRTGITEFCAPASCIEIRKNAFINCRHLEKVTLNDKLEVLGDEAFAVTAISELHTPKSLRHLGNRVAITTKCTFSGDDATFTIHPDCEHLKLDAQGCLYEMGASDGANGAGDDVASDGASNNTDASTTHKMILTRFLDDSVTSINVAPGTTEIGESAFFKHPNLQSVTLPEGVRIIGKCAFKDCEALTHVDIPDTLERIESEAFVNTRIKEIRVPASLVHIGSMALVSAGAFRAEDAPSIQRIDVDPKNKRFYKAGSLLCEHMNESENEGEGDDDSVSNSKGDMNNNKSEGEGENEGEDNGGGVDGGDNGNSDKNENNSKSKVEDQVIVRDTTDHIVRFPRAVTTILPYALGGATDIEELHVSDNIKTIHMRGFSFNCHIPKVFVHLNEPIEGQSDFFFAFPNNMRGKRQLGNAFRTMKSVNVQAIYYCYDLTITNSGSFGTYGKNDDDLHNQMRLIFERLDNPIFMSNVTRETIDKIFLFNIEELGRLFTMFADTNAIDEMSEHLYVREDNIGLLCAGSCIALDDAKRKVENARDALSVVEARLKKLESELTEAQKELAGAKENLDKTETPRTQDVPNKAEDNEIPSGAESSENELSHAQKSVADAQKAVENAQKAVDSTRTRAEKRTRALEDAEKLTENTAKVHDYILKLAHDKFSLTADDMAAQVEKIKHEKEEARKNEPVNKRSYRGGVPSGKPTTGKASNKKSSDATPSDDLANNKNSSNSDTQSNPDSYHPNPDSYHPKSAASDPALRKAIWGR